ncbi:hypothetical protein H9P43_000457 [Blastocladiella emersonii ATCC 22665]|nr:hypothetical protein H9P43_000457 [Blastocladiella emersonii ATCC 22665]
MQLPAMTAVTPFSVLQRQLLRIVASGQPISTMGDSFYATLRKEVFPLARTRDDQVARWEASREFGQHLVRTEVTSHNLGTLMIRLAGLLNDAVKTHEPLETDDESQRPFLVALFDEAWYAVPRDLVEDLVVRLLANVGLDQIVPNTPVAATPVAPGGVGLFGTLHALFVATPVDPSRVADLSSYLLAVLAVQRSVLGNWSSAFLKLGDSTRSGSNLKLPASNNSFSYKRLLQLLQDRLSIPHYAVILYSQLFCNDAFLDFVLAQMDPERLVLPILKFISQAFFASAPPPTPLPGGGATSSHIPFSHVYILMITLIVLTSDDGYLDKLMNVTVTAPDWLQERRVASISLGSVAALVVIRVTQYNLAGDRDQYLHANCVAVLSNLSRAWRNMHPTVALKLVSWFEVTSRRYARLEAIRAGDSPPPMPLSAVSTPLPSPFPGDRPSPFSLSRRTSVIDAHDLNPDTDLIIYTDLVTLLLEIIKTVLHPSSLRFNPNLVHALLYKQALLVPVESHPAFTDLVAGISATLEYFRSKIGEDAPSTTEGVLQQLSDVAKTFQPADLHLPSMRFEYTEDVDSEAFFVPYVWRAVYSGPHLAWDPAQSHLFADDADARLLSPTGQFNELPPLPPLPPLPR